ncbi:hypothetical protein Hypma_004214 [Hypsizygus marmoreus]|uniref:MYND-type domain-containing protein n=1 Tax=Hypsizygus marmoreus TaxID=39966 RepID=A0A369J0C8_HYPMA|nr:hypothetical protein Hypma_004214 [Hypsizygus marmoreus]
MSVFTKPVSLDDRYPGSNRAALLKTLPPISDELKVLGATAAYSVAQLQLLFEWMEADPSLAYYPQLVNVFFHHLEVPPPPNHISPHYAQRVEFAMIAMEGIDLVCWCHLDFLDSEDSLMLSKTRAAWPQLWRWMEYLYYYAGDGLDKSFNAASRPPHHKVAIMDAIQSIISILLQFPSTSVSEAIRTTPGILVMLFEMWVRQTYKARDDKLVNAVHSLSIDIQQCFASPATDISQLADLLVEGGPSLASEVLLPLQLAMYGGAAYMKCYPVVLGVYIDLAKHIPQLQNALLSKGVMHDVCYLLTFLTSVTLEEGKQQASAASCVEYIRQLSVTTDGITWLLQAIRYKFIHNMLRCAAWPLSTFEAQFLLPVAWIGAHVPYRSILHLLGKALASPSVAALEAHVPRDGQFWEKWLPIRTAINDALTVRPYSPARYSVKCHSSKCAAVDLQEDFRLCGTCRDAVYCSIACQRFDWKEGGHRYMCSAIAARPTYDGKNPYLSIRDLTFLAFVMDNEMHRWREMILKKRDAVLSTLPSSDAQPPLVVILQQCAYHYSFEVVLAESFDPNDPVAHGPLLQGNKQLFNRELPDGWVPLVQPYIKILCGRLNVVVEPNRVPTSVEWVVNDEASRWNSRQRQQITTSQHDHQPVRPHCPLPR